MTCVHITLGIIGADTSAEGQANVIECKVRFDFPTQRRVAWSYVGTRGGSRTVLVYTAGQFSVSSAKTELTFPISVFMSKYSILECSISIHI